MSNHDKAGEFRRKAEECRCVADQSADPESKTTWLDFASRWLVCAETVERMSDSTSATGRTTPIGNTTSGLKLPRVAHLDVWPSLGTLCAAPSANFPSLGGYAQRAVWRA
jgi:hypothetical protein